MLNKLKQRWKVNGWGLFLIITTFALGGSACARIGKKILDLLDLEKGFLWTLTYIILITLLWPICVLIISVPLGQFAFFKGYLLRVFRKLIGKKPNKANRIAIFASGAGTNAENIIRFFEKDENIEVALVVCNKETAGVNDVAKRHNIPVLTISHSDLDNPARMISTMISAKINFIVLAGFLKKLPNALVESFHKKIVNIHPALLPKYGGKGMYGKHVHETVVSNKDSISGITIHYVDEVYDNGEIIFQATCEVLVEDNADSLADKIHALEYEHYPLVIKRLIEEQNHR